MHIPTRSQRIYCIAFRREGTIFFFRHSSVRVEEWLRIRAISVKCVPLNGKRTSVEKNSRRRLAVVSAVSYVHIYVFATSFSLLRISLFVAFWF